MDQKLVPYCNWHEGRAFKGNVRIWWTLWWRRYWFLSSSIVPWRQAASFQMLPFPVHRRNNNYKQRKRYSTSPKIGNNEILFSFIFGRLFGNLEMSNVLKEMREKTSIFDYLVSYRLFVRYFNSVYQNEKCTKCLSKSIDVILLYQKKYMLMFRNDDSIYVQK